MKNIDHKTVEGFGEEWEKFDQRRIGEKELMTIFSLYFEVFPWESLPENPVGFDLGCGSGRWAKIVSGRVGLLHCIDASHKALSIAQRNLQERKNCHFHVASVDNMPIDDNTMDFGYSIGVLHHIPDINEGIKSCVAKLKHGAPFLLYLYYALDNRHQWFIRLWKASNAFRLIISRLPFHLRYLISQVIALLIYFPLARTALILEKVGISVEVFPLSSYRRLSFYTMRTDALDRLGTRIEKRFTKREIVKMMEDAGLKNILFCSSVFWCAVGSKKAFLGEYHREGI